MNYKLRSPIMCFVWVAGIGLLFAAPLRAQSQGGGVNKDSFDPDEYPVRAIGGLVSNNPCSGSKVYEVKDILFRSELIYNGDVRDTPVDVSELLKQWTIMVSSADQSG